LVFAGTVSGAPSTVWSGTSSTIPKWNSS